jgi:hypothetical protein
VDTTTFEVTVSLQDMRFVGAVRALVDTAAKYAGCPAEEAARFAGDVENALCACLGDRPPDGLLPVTVRRAAGPIEVLVDGQVLSLDV